MSFFHLIFLSILTNQTDENETLKTIFEILKNLRACLVSVSEYVFCSWESCFETLKTNVFRTGPVIEPEKLPVHGSSVGPAVEQLSNR